MKSMFLPTCVSAFAVMLLACGESTTVKTQNDTPGSKQAQEKDIPVGGGCDGCELMYTGMPASINATDTSSGWLEEGKKILVTGIVYQRDGKTPAKDIIIYYWHTDNNGYYSPITGMSENARRHGHLRGWVKTGADGKYAIYTIYPAPYPNEKNPSHIHTSIKEPGLTEYYIDEFVFDEDPLLTPALRKAHENRGGSGILRLRNKNDLLVAEHNIVLGLNIPGYPTTR